MIQNECVHTIHIPNERARPLYSLKVIKTDCCDTRLRLRGAVFDLLRLDENSCYYTKVLGNLYSDENGEVIISALSPGKYMLVERCAPPGYRICSHSCWAFELNRCAASGCYNIEMVICNCREKKRELPCCLCCCKKCCQCDCNQATFKPPGYSII